MLSNSIKIPIEKIIMLITGNDDRDYEGHRIFTAIYILKVCNADMYRELNRLI